jgi:arginyl-tRNA synthetase
VGNEQNYHFEVLKKVLKKMKYDWADNILHYSYGMVELPEGKMKSREGTVVDADDLISEVTEAARQTTMELGKLENFETTEAEKLFRQIGMGGLKYFILKVDPSKNMMFNPEESIDFNGNTGPFIQYTYARIQSLIRKSGLDVESITFPTDVALQEQERELLILCHDYIRVLHLAAAELSPAHIANYVYELAKQYNQFYQHIPVLKETDKVPMNLRLYLSYFTGTIIEKAMGLLGIEVPEKM